MTSLRVHLRVQSNLWRSLSMSLLFLFSGFIYANEQINQLIAPLQTEANKGDKKALLELANLYFSIFCCTKTDGYDRKGEQAKAVLNYLISMHKEGDGELEFIIGEFYNFGIGTNKNDATAFQWWLKAANNSHPESQHIVGIFYEKGHETPQDFEKAFEWYKKADDLGYRDAPNSIGYMFYKGLGRDVDCQKALKWFNKAVKQGDNQGAVHIESMKKDPFCAPLIIK